MSTALNRRREMRLAIAALSMLLSMTSALGQVSVGVSLPGASIGINVPVYPELVRVPGYPVYYAPRLGSNFFFYDGLYWVYQGDDWYASSWYNGPWGLVAPEAVPVYILRVPVRYYRNPPGDFRGWRPDAPPRWGDHWGRDWEQHRSGWDQWDRRSVPAPAPLPVYQRRYSEDRYPPPAQQPALHSRNYRYQPQDPVVRQHYQDHELHARPAPSDRRGLQPAAPVAQRDPSPQHPSDGHADQDGRRQRHEGAGPPGRGQGQDRDREKGQERGQGHNK
jgi:hypothetical protein